MKYIPPVGQRETSEITEWISVTRFFWTTIVFYLVGTVDLAIGITFALATDAPAWYAVVSLTIAAYALYIAEIRRRWMAALGVW